MNLSDRELLARTLQAEAGNQGLSGMIAAGSVIMNRAGKNRSLRDVILQRGQFSAWNKVTGYAGGEQGQDMNFTPSAEAYRAADALLSGQYTDPTGGATHYYNPDISNPAWGQSAGGEWTKIGSHLFGKAGGFPTGNARLSTRETSQMDQMQQPQQPMGFMDRLRDPRTRLALSALSRSSVGQRLGEIAAADLARQQGLEDEQRKLGQAQQVQNRTAAWLRTQPDGENYARAIESGMDARTVYTQYMNRTKPTKDTYGLTPHFIKDEQGNVKVVQFSSTGEQKVSDLPEGFKLAKGVDRVDAGTHIELRDAVTNEVVATVDKNVGEVEQQKIMGQAGGQAKLDLPKIKAQGQRTIALIDDILSGPFQDILGPVQGRVQPDTVGAQGIVGREGIGLIVKLGQLQGTVFLQAFQSLKGGGQITNIEGQKAENAAARLNRFQSPQDFAAALTELRDVISEGIRSAEANAQSGNSVADPYTGSVSFNQQPQPAAQVGEGQAAPQGGWTDVGGGVRIRKKSQQNGG